MSMSETGGGKRRKEDSTPILMSLTGVNLIALSAPLAWLFFANGSAQLRAEAILPLAIAALALDFLVRVARAMIQRHQGVATESAAAVKTTERILHRGVRRRKKRDAGLLVDLGFSGLFILAIFGIGGWLVAAPLFGAAGMLVFCFALYRAHSLSLAERRRLDTRRFDFIAEALARITTVKSNQMEAPLLRRHELLQGQEAVTGRKLIFLSILLRGGGALISAGAVVLMAAAGGWLALQQVISAEAALACVLFTGFALNPFQGLIRSVINREGASLAMINPGVLSAPPVHHREAQEGEFRGEVEARNLSLLAPGGARRLFENLSFHVKPGECLAVNGDDGSGKAALLRACLGEEIPADGAIYLDGVMVSTLGGFRGRGGVGYVERRAPVFTGSVLENLAPGQAPDQLEAALEFAKQLGLDEDFAQLPEGYETLLADSYPVSKAFRQRLNLARVLALRPRLMLFNEANTALGRAADERALEVISGLKGKATLILVSRRPAWLSLADSQIHLHPAKAGHPAAREAETHSKEFQS